MAVGGDTVTVIDRVPLLDGQGHPVLDELGIPRIQVVTVDVTGCSFEELRSSEHNSNTNPSTGMSRVFMPYNATTAAITPDTALVFDGQTYEVQGPRRLWTDLDGTPDHVVITCRWMEG